MCAVSLPFPFPSHAATHPRPQQPHCLRMLFGRHNMQDGLGGASATVAIRLARALFPTQGRLDGVGRTSALALLP